MCYTQMAKKAAKTREVVQQQRLADVARSYIFSANLRQPCKGYCVISYPGAKRRLPLNHETL
jgi:hypothetical protein